MKTKELFASIDKEALLKRFIEIYDDQEKNLEGYKHALDEMASLGKEEYNGREDNRELGEILVQLSKSFLDEEPEIDISIRVGDTLYAMEFTDWREVLNSEVASDTLTNFSNIDAACHILWEMTFVGFSNEEVIGKMDELNEQLRQLRETDPSFAALKE